MRCLSRGLPDTIGAPELAGRALKGSGSRELRLTFAQTSSTMLGVPHKTHYDPGPLAGVVVFSGARPAVPCHMSAARLLRSLGIMFGLSTTETCR
jgi:hypothetical protein